jgi:hypothetical protein
MLELMALEVVVVVVRPQIEMTWLLMMYWMVLCDLQFQPSGMKCWLFQAEILGIDSDVQRCCSSNISEIRALSKGKPDHR